MENLRRQLQMYIDLNGVMQKHIANKVGISRTMVCLFLKGEKNLGEENSRKLQEFLLKI